MPTDPIVAALWAEMETLRGQISRYRPHADMHELVGLDTVRLSIQNGGTQLERVRAINFGTGLTATEDLSNRRITVTLAAHGAATHDNRTRNVWMGLGDFVLRSGTPAVVVVGTNTNIAAWAFDGAGGTEDIVGQKAIPEDWASGSVTFKLWWANLGAGAGNVRWSVYAASGGDATNLDVGDAVTSDVVAAAAQYVLKVTTHSHTVTPTAGQMLRVIIHRNSAHADDTLANDAGLLGLELEYTADM